MEDWVLLTLQQYPHHYEASELITRPLVSLTMSQEANLNADSETICENPELHKTCSTSQQHKDLLPDDLKCHAELASERGASSWIAVLPIEEHRFHLHKGEFRDALRLRYNRQLNNTPKMCN